MVRSTSQYIVAPFTRLSWVCHLQSCALHVPVVYLQCACPHLSYPLLCLPYAFLEPVADAQHAEALHRNPHNTMPVHLARVLRVLRVVRVLSAGHAHTPMSASMPWQVDNRFLPAHVSAMTWQVDNKLLPACLLGACMLLTIFFGCPYILPCACTGAVGP